MPSEQITCLFCQTKNNVEEEICSNCGMALATKHPEGKARLSFFVKAFWGIVIFCILMMYYLPR